MDLEKAEKASELMTKLGDLENDLNYIKEKVETFKSRENYFKISLYDGCDYIEISKGAALNALKHDLKALESKLKLLYNKIENL